MAVSGPVFGEKSRGRDWLIALVAAMAFMGSFTIAIGYKKHFTLMGFSTIDAGVFLSAAGTAGLFGKLAVATVAGSVFIIRLILWIALAGFGFPGDLVQDFLVWFLFANLSRVL